MVNGGERSREARNDWQGKTRSDVRGVSSHPRGSWLIARMKRSKAL